MTSETGVYVGYWSELQGYDRVFVYHETDDGVTDLVEVKLPSADAQRLIKTEARDLEFQRRRSSFTKEQGAAYIAATANILALRRKADEVSPKDAEKRLTQVAAQVAAKTFDENGKPIKLLDLHNAIKPKLQIGLPSHELLQGEKFQQLKGTKLFEDAVLRPAIDPTIIDKLRTNPRELSNLEVQTILTLSGRDITPEMFSDTLSTKLVSDYVGKVQRGDTIHVGVVDRTRRDFTTAVPGITFDGNIQEESVRRLILESPQAREWLLHKALLKEGKLSDHQKEEVQKRSEKLAPVIIKHSSK